MANEPAPATKDVKRKFAPWAEPGAAPLIRIEAVTKRFGSITAVDRLSLDIYEGEFFALLGPSGCGKTTLLRMLAGFESANGGKIMLAGEDMARVPPYVRPVNMMFQNYALFPHLTVEGNIAFGLKQDDMAKRDIAARVTEMLHLVKLEGFAKRKPDQLSGGQRQRVALARSLAKRPKVLLLDEPLAALDKKLRRETQFELMELQRKLGLTFIIVTHDQEEAMTMADRIAVMDQGKIVQVGTPTEVYEQPNSRYVAEFIGDVNIFEGRVATVEQGRVGIETAPGRINVSGGQGLALSNIAWVAVRPEKMSVTDEGPLRVGENCFAGRVREIGYLGDMSTYKIMLDTRIEVRVATANVTRRVSRIGVGDRVWVSWAPDAVIVLHR